MTWAPEGQLRANHRDLPYDLPGEFSLWEEFVEVAVSETEAVCDSLLKSGVLTEFRGQRAENAITAVIYKALDRRFTQKLRDGGLPLGVFHRSNLTTSGKEPDLRVRHLTWDPEMHYFCWECKCVRQPDRGGLASLYCREGIVRFATLQYSESVPHAGMLAYVVNGRHSACVDLINSHLQESERILTTESRLLPTYRSNHARSGGASSIGLTHFFLEL